MRGLTVVAWVIGGLPVVAFAATLALTDGAPIRAPSAGSGMPDVARMAPDRQEPPAFEAPAGIPTRAPDHMEAQNRRTDVRWTPPPAGTFRDDRNRAGWERLRRLAESGDRDALVFLTLMRSGAIPGPARVRNAAAP
ncbi:MAG: hypothetical protein ABJ215_02365 [Alphaproteobacteria bacterium]